jgi:hypothetical protein
MNKYNQQTPFRGNGYSSKRLALGNPENQNPIVKVKTISKDHAKEAIKKARRVMEVYHSPSEGS